MRKSKLINYLTIIFTEGGLTQMIKIFKKGFQEKDLLIFLDIDGVLNTSNSFNTKYEVHEENIKALSLLIDDLKKQGYFVKIILTSTWRLGYDSAFEKCSEQVKELITKLDIYNIHIADKTPVYKANTRDKEILRYIRGYQLENNNFTYIILDDDVSIYDNNVLKSLNFYKVNQHTGLVKNDINKIMKII